MESLIEHGHAEEVDWQQENTPKRQGPVPKFYDFTLEGLEIAHKQLEVVQVPGMWEVIRREHNRKLRRH